MSDDRRYLPALINHSNAVTNVERRIADASNARNPVTGVFRRIGLRTAIATMVVETEHARTLTALITENGHVLEAVDKFLDISARSQAKRDLAPEIYLNHLHGEMDVFQEAAHLRELAIVRRHKEVFIAKTEQLQAKHRLEAETEFKDAKFAAGHARFDAKVAGRKVDTAVANAAAAKSGEKREEPKGQPTENADVAAIHAMILKKQSQIEEREADGKDTTKEREQLEKLRALLMII